MDCLVYIRVLRHFFSSLIRYYFKCKIKFVLKDRKSPYLVLLFISSYEIETNLDFDDFQAWCICF